MRTEEERDILFFVLTAELVGKELELPGAGAGRELSQRQRERERGPDSIDRVPDPSVDCDRNHVSPLSFSSVGVTTAPACTCLALLRQLEGALLLP